MTSLALGDLGGRLNEVRLLSRLDPLRLGSARQDDLSNAVSKAGIVLLCAHLEGFLEDVAAEAIDLMVGRAKIDDVPLLLRSLHVEEHLKALEPMKDPKARAPKIERMFQSEADLWLPGKVLQATMVRPKMVCSEMSNPGSREIRQFLELLDVDIEDYLLSIGESGLLNRVNGLVARRNSIAHGEVSATVTNADVEQYLELVEQLSRCIDDAVGLSIKGMCGLSSLPW
jgi:hypothetical protein